MTQGAPGGASPLREYRDRLLDGFAAAVVERGYAKTTIADIVRAAKVSKRTFYESFDDKQACFLAVYARESRVVLARVQEAAIAETSWRAQLEAGVRAYIETLASNPALTRVCFLEIHAAGILGLELRRAVLDEFSTALRLFVELARAEDPEIAGLSPSMAVAVTGGINELLLLSVERGDTLRTNELTAAATELLRAVLSAAGR